VSSDKELSEDNFFCYLHFIDKTGKYVEYLVTKEASTNFFLVKNLITTLYSPKDGRVFFTFKR